MSEPIIVAFPVHNRPELLTRVLDGWSKVRGVEDAVLEFHCEPDCPDAVDLCRTVPFTTTRTYVNPTRLGHAWNVFKSMGHATAFAAPYVIQAADDYLPSTDLLELHAWHRDNYATDESVLALRSGTDYPHGGPDAMAAVWRTQLIGILSGFHAHKWRWLAARWQEGTGNWWEWVNLRWLQGGQGLGVVPLDVLAPALSRAEDLGGPFEPSPASSCFVSDPPPQQYFEVKDRKERAIGWWRLPEEAP